MSFLCSRNSIMIMKDDDDGGEQPEQMMMMGGGGGMGMTAGTMRKGPWTEEEDVQLVRFVRLFGERRWDFLAKVSGLRRTGKSCRLRWVNYLHPGLRRSRITADEERLIVELHAKWGSRWSRIARSLPGRTDNEIKNFWRTRTRKKALEERRRGGGGDGGTAGSSSPSPSSSSATTTSECPGADTSSSDSSLREEGSSGGDDDEAEAELELEEASPSTTTAMGDQQQPQEASCYTTTTMDQLWNEIAAADAQASYVIDAWGSCCFLAEPSMLPPPSPVWDYCSDYDGLLWKIDDEEYYKKMLDAS